jgi:hypothetical protein
MTTYIFTPPTVEEGPSGSGSPLFRYFRLKRGISIGKLSGVYFQARYTPQDDSDTYDEWYQGGHKYTGISDATRTALIAGGVSVTSANFVAE